MPTFSYVGFSVEYGLDDLSSGYSGSSRFLP